MEDQPETSDGRVDTEEPESEAVGLGIEHMPDHVLLKMFDYLNMAELAQCTLVCSRWHYLLRGQKFLWKKKRYCTHSTFDREELQSVADAMPQLKCLHIVTAMETAVHIAWPEAAVCLKCDSSCRRVQKMTEFVKFNTDAVVVGTFAFPAFLSWVRCDKLRKIYVADPCFIVRNNPQTPFYFGDAPNCGITCDPKVYCAFCTYNHHRSCTGATCTLRLPINQCGHPWCDDDKLKPERKVLRRTRRPRRAVTHSEDEAQPGPSTQDDSLPLPALKEANVLCTFVTSDHMEFLFKSCRPTVLRIHCRLFNFSFLRHCRSSLEELTLTSTPVLPPYSELCELKKLKVLRVAQYGGLKPFLKDLFQTQCSPQKTDVTSSSTCVH